MTVLVDGQAATGWAEVSNGATEPHIKPSGQVARGRMQPLMLRGAQATPTATVAGVAAKATVIEALYGPPNHSHPQRTFTAVLAFAATADTLAQLHGWVESPTSVPKAITIQLTGGRGLQLDECFLVTWTPMAQTPKEITTQISVSCRRTKVTGAKGDAVLRIVEAVSGGYPGGTTARKEVTAQIAGVGVVWSACAFDRWGVSSDKPIEYVTLDCGDVRPAGSKKGPTRSTLAPVALPR